MKIGWLILSMLCFSEASCTDVPRGPVLAKPERLPERLEAGQHYPDCAEVAASGPIEQRIAQGSRAYDRLVRYGGANVIFKNEENSDSDRIMSRRLRDRINTLAGLVGKEWQGVVLRITEAWDCEGEHGGASLHYEGRAADMTISDRDPKKLGRLARLAIDAGFDWVYFEDGSHVHASVKRD